MIDSLPFSEIFVFINAEAASLAISNFSNLFLVSSLTHSKGELVDVDNSLILQICSQVGVSTCINLMIVQRLSGKVSFA